MSRSPQLYVWKYGALVRARLPGAKFFEPVGTGVPTDPARVISIDTETLPDGHGQIHTVLSTVAFQDRAVAIESWDGRNVIERLLDVLFEREGF